MYKNKTNKKSNNPKLRVEKIKKQLLSGNPSEGYCVAIDSHLPNNVKRYDYITMDFDETTSNILNEKRINLFDMNNGSVINIRVDNIEPNGFTPFINFEQMKFTVGTEVVFRKALHGLGRRIIKFKITNISKNKRFADLESVSSKRHFILHGVEIGYLAKYKEKEMVLSEEI